MAGNTPSEGIKDLLVAANVGVFAATSGWSIVIGKMIEKPDSLIVVREFGGKAPNPKWNIDFPSVQVRVRDNEYLDARAKAQEVKDALLGLPSRDLNGDRWTAINMVSDIVDVGVDQNDRQMFTLNFALIIEPSSAGNRSTGD